MGSADAPKCSSARRLVAVAGIVLALSTSGVVIAGRAPRAGAISDLGYYQVVAQADGFSFELVDPQAPVVPGGQVIFASPTSTQGVIDSTGISQAFASAPYPGNFAATLPGTINGVADGRVSVPSYPYYVASSSPATPKSSQSHGLFALEATSAPDESAGEATAALLATAEQSIGSVHSASRVALDRATHTITARAVTKILGLRVGPLRIGEVTSSAVVKGPIGEAPTKTSSFDVTSMSVNDVAVTLDKEGLKLGPEATPVPDIGAVTKILEAAGISVVYIPAAETPTGIESAGMAIRYTAKVPERGDVLVTIQLGRVTAKAASTLGPRADDGALMAPGGGVDEAPPVQQTAAPGTPVASPAPPSSGAPALPAILASSADVGASSKDDPSTAAATIDLAAAGDVGSAALPDPGAGAAAAHPEKAAGGRSAVRAVTSYKEVDGSHVLYLALALTGFGLVGGGWLFGTLAVRRRARG